MKVNGFQEDEDIPIKDTKDFTYSWMAIKLLKFAFTNNLYVYTCIQFLTSSQGVIQAKLEITDEFLGTCEKIKIM